MAHTKSVLYGVDDPSRVDSPNPEQRPDDMPDDIARAFLNIDTNENKRSSPSRDVLEKKTATKETSQEDISDDISNAFLGMSVIPSDVARRASPALGLPADHRSRTQSPGSSSLLRSQSPYNKSPSPGRRNSPSPRVSFNVAPTYSETNPFQANFHGRPCPQILHRYYDFERKSISSETYFIAGFEWITKPLASGSNKWVPAAYWAQFLPFAQADSSGSLFALWAYPAMQTYQSVAVEKAPVVYMGNEGQAFVVANSVVEFIALQASGVTGDDFALPPDLGPKARLPDFDPEFDPLLAEGAPLFRKFYAWAKQQGIKVIPRQSVWEIVRNAQGKHPDVSLLKYVKRL